MVAASEAVGVHDHSFGQYKQRLLSSERYTCGGFGARCGETTHVFGRPLSSCKMTSSYHGDSIVGRSLPVHRTPPCLVIRCPKPGKAVRMAPTCNSGCSRPRFRNINSRAMTQSP